MARRPLEAPLQKHPVLRCTIQGTSAFKLDGDGAGKLILTFDSSQSDVIAELYKRYRETELHATFIKVAT